MVAVLSFNAVCGEMVHHITEKNFKQQKIKLAVTNDFLYSGFRRTGYGFRAQFTQYLVAAARPSMVMDPSHSWLGFGTEALTSRRIHLNSRSALKILRLIFFTNTNKVVLGIVTNNCIRIFFGGRINFCLETPSTDCFVRPSLRMLVGPL